MDRRSSGYRNGVRRRSGARDKRLSRRNAGGWRREYFMSLGSALAQMGFVGE